MRISRGGRSAIRWHAGAAVCHPIADRPPRDSPSEKRDFRIRKVR